MNDERKVGTLIFCAVVVFCCTALAVRQSFAAGNLISSDAVGWFSFLVSLVNKQTLTYGDTLALFGRYETHAPVGAALAWLPFYLFGRIISLLAVGFFGLPWVNDGTGLPEQLACCVAGIVYGAAAVSLCYRLACRWFPSVYALPAVLLLFAAGNLPNYVLAEPYMTHSISVFLTTLLLWVGMREEPLGIRDGAMVGAVAGLAALTRPTDGLFVVLPFLWHLLRGQSWKTLVKPLLLAALVSAGIFSLQVLVWELNRSFSSERVLPKGFQGAMHWSTPRWFRHLFGPRYGLFTFHPIYLLAVGGVPFLFRRQRILASVAGIGLLIQFYVICSWSGQGQSFGSRMFLGCFPLFAIGLAALIQSSLKARILLKVTFIPLVVINILLFLNYRGMLQLF